MNITDDDDDDDDDDDELQAGALVIIYKDGSVLITHGGTEMGQGLHTKMIQVYCNVLTVSWTFEWDFTFIYIGIFKQFGEGVRGKISLHSFCFA